MLWRTSTTAWREQNGLKITILKQDGKGRIVGPFWTVIDDVESIGYCGETIVPTGARFYATPADFSFSFDENGFETMHNEEAFSEHCSRVDPKNRKTAHEHRMDYVGMIERFFSPLTIVVLNTMVFLNVRNVSVRTIGPSRKEAAKLGIVPTAMSKYSYRVIDIFRELDPELMRFEDIEKFIRSRTGSSGADRRAHLVCGHFKKKRGSLFWWNSHMRNAKNIDPHRVCRERLPSQRKVRVGAEVRLRSQPPFPLFCPKAAEPVYNSNANPQQNITNERKEHMAKAKNAPPKEKPSLGGAGLMSALEGIMGEVGVKESRTYRPVPTGINVLDFYNARYFMNHETKEWELFSGMPIGKLILKIGYTGAGKTTLCVQEALALVEPYESGTVFHFDLENAWSKERTADITGLPMDVVDKKYKRFDPVPLETIYAFVKKVINAKQEMMTDPNSEIWVEDVRTGERIPTPTVIIIDTVAALQSTQVMEEKEEMGSLLFESGAQAKANNAFAQRLTGMIGDPNITIYAVNHIRVDPGPSGGPPKAKRIQYLNMDETCPGGTGFPQYSDYFLKMVPCESLTNKADEGFAIPGKVVRCTIVKSRLSYDGRQFELVLTANGISNAWTNLHFLKQVKALKGAGAHLFIEAPDGRQTQKFAQRNWEQLYEGDEAFREIADARLEAELMALVPQPGATAAPDAVEESEQAAG